FRGDGGEGAAELQRCAGLGVPGVEVGRAAPQPQEQHGAGAGGGGAGLGPDAQQVGEGEAEDRAAADLKEGTARQRLAGALPLLADPEHAVPSCLGAVNYIRAAVSATMFLVVRWWGGAV